ncbi:MAG: 4-hydroxy-3-methylbut-2-enyl diphosphate reductase [Lentisphaeria bacterium]|nr:4-hydroxy-3-methylbut-2-enyl diphosphate reductase [Lentisphaeria bacterium]
MNIKIAQCCGMCSGVRRALKITEEALAECNGKTLYVYHEIVHNTMVINELKNRNVVFVHSIDDIPDGSLTVFSAHGVSRSIEEQAAAKKLRVFDATCLLVRKNHNAAEEAHSRNKRIVFIGKKSHPECIGTVGRVPAGYAYVVENENDIKSLPDCGGEIISIAQTTLAESDVGKIKCLLSAKYPQIKHLDGICFATSTRQNAIRELAKECGLILVAGSPASSNSCRLVQIARECGCPAELVDNEDDLKEIDFSGISTVGISAGASTPQKQIDWLLAAVRLK